MDQAFDARLQLDECAVFGDVGDSTVQLHADRILRCNTIPRIAFELLHAEADALRFLVDANDLDGHSLADLDHFARVVDALVAHVGDVEQAVYAAEVDERTVIGDVLDHTFSHLTFGELVDQLAALFGAGFFKYGTARNNDVAAAAIHLEDLEGLGHVHQRSDVAHRSDVDLRAGQECYGAVEVDGEAALDAAEDTTFDALAFAKFVLELVPGGFAACAVAAEHCFAVSVFDAVDINFDFAADAQTMVVFATGKFLEVDAAFGFEAYVDNGHAVFDRCDSAFYDAAFKAAVFCTTELFVEKRFEIVARGVGRSRHVSSFLNVCYRPPVVRGLKPPPGAPLRWPCGQEGRVLREAGCRRRGPFNQKIARTGARLGERRVNCKRIAPWRGACCCEVKSYWMEHMEHGPGDGIGECH